MTVLGPVTRHERIDSLDTLRGFALLGILLMNIVGFALHEAAYDDPTVAGGATGANLASWVVLHILAEGKMRCLFSMVFGASVVLLTTRTEQRTAGTESADIFYRRNLWLMLFGLAHGYLLWQGEVLYAYAICALVLYPFRHAKARMLLAIAGTLIVLNIGANMLNGFRTSTTIRLAKEADAAEKAGRKLTDGQAEAKKEWAETRERAKPTAAEIQKDAAAWRGTPLEVLARRAKAVYGWHSTPYYHPWNWDVWSMMFLGMALFRLGVFSAARSQRFYLGLVVAGYAVGLVVNSYTAWMNVRSGFDVTTHTYSFVVYDIGRLSVALGHVGVLMLVCKAGILRLLTKAFAAIGQTALSNYILQSVICAFVFTGYGLALFGRLERYQLYFVVAGVWAVSMVASPLWLRRYRFGPVEWCWRSLTYWKRQPMRIEQAERAATATASAL